MFDCVTAPANCVGSTSNGVERDSIDSTYTNGSAANYCAVRELYVHHNALGLGNNDGFVFVYMLKRGSEWGKMGVVYFVAGKMRLHALE